MSECFGRPVQFALRDRFRNLRSSNSPLLAESGVHDKTLLSILRRAQAHYETHGYEKVSQSRLEARIQSGDRFFCHKDHASDYTIMSKIGHGNSGTVYSCRVVTRGRGEQQERTMAIKVLRLDDTTPVNTNLVCGFLKEIYIHDYLIRHDPDNQSNILRFERVLLGGPRSSYVAALSHLGHKSLSTLLKSNSVLSIGFIKRLIPKILRSLSTLHGIGVNHCDLKCGNILFDRPIDTCLVEANDERKMMFESDAWAKRHQRNFEIKVKTSSCANASRKTYRKPTRLDILDLDPTITEIGIQLVDMGASVLYEEYHHKICCAHHLRAPEDLFEIGDGNLRDIWALGLLLFEMYTGYKWNPYVRGRYNTPQGWEMLLANHQPVLPPEWNQTENRNYDKRPVLPLEEGSIDPIEEHFSSDEEAQWLLKFILQCLVIDPDRRPNADQLLERYFGNVKET